jgi:hypothetical protein
MGMTTTTRHRTLRGALRRATGPAPLLAGLVLLAAACGGGTTTAGSPGEGGTVGTDGPTTAQPEETMDTTPPEGSSSPDDAVTLLPDDGSGDGSTVSTPPFQGELAGAELEVVPEGGGDPVTLVCDFSRGVVSGSGTHPLANEACADLQAGLAAGDPFAPVPPDAACTQQFGGEAVVAVRGTLTGTDGATTPVDATFRLSDGCEIARWENLGRVLEPFRGSV